jgi:hypothetical protein
MDPASLSHGVGFRCAASPTLAPAPGDEKPKPDSP